MKAAEKNLGNLIYPLKKLCEFQIKRRCTDTDDHGKYMPLPLTGLAAAREFAFFCGVSGDEFIKSFNVTAHVRSLKDIISLNRAHASRFDEIFSGQDEYLEYLKSTEGQETLFAILVANKVGMFKNTTDVPENTEDESFYEKKEREERERDDQQIINGTICAAVELGVSFSYYHETEDDPSRIAADYADFRIAFTESIDRGHSEMVAYNALEKTSIAGRVSCVNDFVELFVQYAASHLDDSFFFKSLGTEMPEYGVFATEEDEKMSNMIKDGLLPDVPMNSPKVVKL